MTYSPPALRHELYESAYLEQIDLPYTEDVLASTWRASAASRPVHRMLDVDVRTYLPGDFL